ncbi:phosphoheptose isomerase [Catellatospora sp. IY07-71]|uniref:D-sedoheptulose-7-phosphate isomerase n=1 Tax=Catellatospora sp. IY07-71 TaxID=2728827 RepID=UPI001BB3CAE1|nr:SIS domain-containing protein [Catellatospora sp. IY07-71]BCJ77169.1 phosphoheptose isomerase [Catellatospora sp. IY07-71]
MTAAERGAPAQLGALYPFLYAAPAQPAASSVDDGAEAAQAGGPGRASGPDTGARHPDLIAALTASTAAKLRDAAALRARVLTEQAAALSACASDLAAVLGTGGRLFTFGNGGSATDAVACAELFAAPPGRARPLPAYALSADVAVLSALANDVGIEAVFARQVAAHARPGDVVIGFSTSGNSPNLLAGFAQARARGVVTVGFSGGAGGRLAEPGAADHLFVVRSPSVHRIQEAQTTACHVLWELTVAGLGGGADRRPRAAQGVYADDRNDVPAGGG